MMSKEHYMAAHEEMIGEYMEKYPDADYAEAYDKTADAAYDRMVNNLAAQADNLRKRMQEQR